MTTNNDVSKLDDLIVTTIDSSKGYEHSADKAEAGRFGSLFATLAAERRDIVAALQAESRRLGETPSDFGSAAATIHRRVEDLRVALGGGDKAILAEIERGETYLGEEYERALRQDLSLEVRAVLERCYAEVRQGAERIGLLREGLQAAA